MLVVIAIELAVILVLMVGCVVSVVSEGRRANRRSDRLMALIAEQLGVEREIAEAASDTAELAGEIEVEARETRKALAH